MASFNGRLIYLHYLVERLQKFLNMAFSLLQNWMAYTNIKIKNFTLTDSLVFTKNQLQPSRQANYAFCQVLQRKLLCGNYKWITKINLFLFLTGPINNNPWLLLNTHASIIILRSSLRKKVSACFEKSFVHFIHSYVFFFH